jgi:hypothetical protein
MTNSTEGEPAKVHPNVQVAAALLRRDDAIVLVQERRGETVFWSVPSGGGHTAITCRVLPVIRIRPRLSRSRTASLVPAGRAGVRQDEDRMTPDRAARHRPGKLAG